MAFDYLFTGAEVYDGLGNPPRCVDVGVTGDQISAVEHNLRAEAAEVVDLTGYVLCPGFIDVHSHSDIYALVEPSAFSKITQGVTTEVVGNCGASAAPRYGAHRLPADWARHTLPGEWQTVADYRALVDTVQPAVNLALLVGHNTLRAGTVGYEGRAATTAEMQQMKDRLRQALDEGALGLSTGLIYIPGRFAPREEVEKLCRVVAEQDGIYTSHMRSEGDGLWEALDETLNYGRASGVRVQVSHLKTSGRANWSKLDGALERIWHARERDGLDVCADRYPYTAACTDLDIVLPDWALDGGRTAILERVRDPQTHARLRTEMTAARDPDYWGSVTVGSVHHPAIAHFKGVPLCDVAKELALDPVEALLHLIDLDELQTTGIFFGMSEDNMWRILAEPYVMLGSDGSVFAPTGPLSSNHPHPRAYGSFPRWLRAVCDGCCVPLAEAIRKMTALPAAQFGFSDRGVLAPGYRADLTAFHKATVADRADFVNPHQAAVGIEYVMVNGVPTLANGQLTGHRAGVFVG